MSWMLRIEHHTDAMGSEQIGRANAGKLQQLRRVIGAARHQDFTPRANRPDRAGGIAVLDRRRATSLENDALGQRRGLDRKPSPALRRAQIAHGGAGSAAAPCRGLEETGALLKGAVEIGISGYSVLCSCRNKGLGEGIRMSPVRHRQWTANPVEVIVARSGQGGGVLGVIDGSAPKGVEGPADVTARHDFLRKIGYKK